MAKWIRNQYDKALTYENLMKAHNSSKKGKMLRKASCGYKFKATPPKEFYESIKTLRELSFKLDDMVKAKINFKYYDADKIENTLVHLIADIKEKSL